MRSKTPSSRAAGDTATPPLASPPAPRRGAGIGTGKAGRGGPIPPAARRRLRKRKRPTDDGSLLAWRCVVLSVDTATRSGWAVRVAGRLTDSGELDTLDVSEIDYVLHTATRAAEHARMPLVLVLERPWGGFQSSTVVAALGAARERWLAAWRRIGGSMGRVVSVHVSTWRARVLGRDGVGKSREIVREVERRIAAAELTGSPHAADLGYDEAAAILISRWAARAPQVGKALPKRVQAQSVPLPLLQRVDQREAVRR